MATKAITESSTSVKAYVISVNETTTKTVQLFQTITEQRGLPPAYWEYNKVIIPSGLKTWLAMKAIDSIILEIMDGKRVVERYDLNYEYSAANVQDDNDLQAVIPQSDQISLNDLIAKLEALPPHCEYRVFAFLKPGAPMAEGWYPTTPGDISHLTKIDTNIGIHSSRINGKVVVWGQMRSNTRKP